MKLEHEDVELFYKLHSHLLLFVNEKLKLLEHLKTVTEILDSDIKEKVKIRESLYQDRGLIEEFATSNPYNFNEEELNIVRSWKDFVNGKFYILRHLKKYCIFLSCESEDKAYGVKGLLNSFDEIVGTYLPIMTMAVLLPFKGEIIYDGILLSYNISFGSGIRKRLNETYEEAKAKYGIISSLNLLPSNQLEQNDEDTLRFYLKNQSNRQNYQTEISNLINKNRNLLILYHQELGKIHAKSYSKNLRELGFSNVWFAILSGMIIASEKTKQALELLLDNITPVSQRPLIYVFHLKK